MKNITSINGITITAQEDLDGHVKNSAAHVTEEERTEWNAAPPVSAGGILIAPQEDLDEHVNDAVVHITEEEREEWNAKTTVNAKGILIATQEGLDGHAGNTTVHITEEERAGWDAKPGTEEITQLDQRINEQEDRFFERMGPDGNELEIRSTDFYIRTKDAGELKRERGIRIRTFDNYTRLETLSNTLLFIQGSAQASQFYASADLMGGKIGNEVAFRVNGTSATFSCPASFRERVDLQKGFVAVGECIIPDPVSPSSPVPKSYLDALEKRVAALEQASLEAI